MLQCNQLCTDDDMFLQALKKGSNSLYTGIIIGCAPFFVVISSPIFGYYVRKNINLSELSAIIQ